jgi:hypothetical protein
MSDLRPDISAILVRLVRHRFCGNTGTMADGGIALDRVDETNTCEPDSAKLVDVSCALLDKAEVMAQQRAAASELRLGVIINPHMADKTMRRRTMDRLIGRP